MAEPPLCSLHELRTVYSLPDLLDFHVVLDLNEDLQRAARAKAKQLATKGP